MLEPLEEEEDDEPLSLELDDDDEALDDDDDEELDDDDEPLSLELSFLELPALLYRSEYQPPPLRMKPAPPDTWRLAEA